jgi:ataxia telangiectasia mutated family protein
LDIAKLAFSRHEYFTALLNIELWYEESFGTLHGIDKNNDNGLTASSPRKQLLPSTEKMLADIFERIGEDDALYAFATTIDFATQLKIFEHEKRWDKVLQSYDILLNNDVDHREERLEKGILKCMKNLGCSHLLATHGRKYQQSVNFELSEEQYERAWHQCKWDFPAIDLNAADEPKLNQGIYNCLYALKSKDVDFFKGSKNILHKFAVNNICVNGKESAAIVNDSIIVLQMIDLLQNSFNARSTIVECGWSLNGKEIQIYANSTFSKDPGNALNKTIQLEDRYHLLKPLFKLYSSALTALDCKIGLQRAHLYEACVSRKAKDLTQSRANMAIVKQMCKVNKIDRNFEIEIQLEELQNLWDQGLNKVALDECKRLYKAVEEQNRSNSTTLFQASVASMLLGRWLADSCSESVDRIREILGDSVNFAKNAALLGNTDKADELHYTLCSSHFNLAQFADRQYRAIQKQQNSPEWQDRQKLLRHTNKQLEALASKTGYKNSTSYRDILHYKVIAERFHEEDKKEAVRVEESKELFLQLSLTHYTKALTTGDFFDNQVVFRLCQLWFELSSNDKVNAIMAKAGTDVASYKFLCLIYQIGSRLATGNKTFQSAISALLIKMCFEHPYQTLPQIFQFFNASRGKDGTDRDSKRNSGYAVDKTKVIAAKAILEKVKREDKRSSERLFQLQLIIDAYIHLAVLPVKKDGNKPLDPHMPRSVRELKNLECVPIITKDLQVDKSCQYATFPHFSYFKSEIRMVGGVNAPKLLTAVDSEGHLHLQLAKSGDDDLRQDAVMQQLFNLVNHLLEACAKTRKRHLRLKTYNVVPLTPAAGLVEWVRETMPLKEYLVDAGNGNGAHRRLRPKDWSYNQCLSYLYRQQNAKPKAKKDAFTTICKHFKPVMHHFFLEHYVNTSRWFQKRLAYTRSIAVSSMVGYVVGLGDRHGSNILIDEKTAEVIHIDLGIAFEQGKVSKIPETVPFRLTRDIVDGMGVSGVEGTMRRCSEEVMEVLRANKEQLLTIVEVFIHDPLYRWALSPVKALFRQRENVENENAENNEGEDFKYQSIMANGFELSAPMASSQMVENADAERAVLKVREKLEGMEHGMEKTSIEGQVQQLLREAQDVNNLSVMYCGWGPFL